MTSKGLAVAGSRLSDKTAIKIAKIRRDTELQHELFQLIQHPVFSVCVAVVGLELLRKTEMFSGFWESAPIKTLEGVLVAESVITSLAKSGIFEQVAKAAPAIAALG